MGNGVNRAMNHVNGENIATYQLRYNIACYQCEDDEEEE